MNKIIYPKMELTKGVIDWLRAKQKEIGFKRVVIGISGGKDSSVVAALCCAAFGTENVHGIMMPNGEQKDIEDSVLLCNTLGISSQVVNIDKAFGSIVEQTIYVDGEIKTPDALINLPARLRMATLYAYAQSHDAFVIGTCNRSEDVVGYATWGGDNFASLMPIAMLTTEEVMAMGDDLGLPEHLVHKTPVDGLQELSDEEKLGFTYHEVNELIREGKEGPNFWNIMKMYKKNRFKLKYLQIPAYQPAAPDFFARTVETLDCDFNKIADYMKQKQ